MPRTSLTSCCKWQTHVALKRNGPNINWDVLQMLHQKCKQNEHSMIIDIDIGSCGLRIIHGAFQTGSQSQNWNLDKIFWALYNLFNDFSRWWSYLRLCGFNKFAYEKVFHLFAGLLIMMIQLTVTVGRLTSLILV